MEITGKNIIGFNLEATGSVVYQTVNPKLNSPNLWQFFEATKEEIDKAVLLAENAFEQYSQLAGYERSQFLLTIRALLNANQQLLIQCYCLESGLSAARSQTELNRTMWQLELFAHVAKTESWRNVAIDTSDSNRKPAPKPDLRKMQIPLGPVAVFGSSNFPFAYSTIGGDSASALAVGCPVIVKSHPMHAGTSELVARLVNQAAKETGMPNGVFSNINALGFEVGQQLVKHTGIKAVGFTGSIKGGRALLDIANQRPEPIPFFAEMGSINPMLFLEDALLGDKLEQWATKYTASLLTDAGQFCTNPGLILGFDHTDFHQFLEKVAELVSKQPSSCMLHPTIHQNFEKGKTLALAQQNVFQLSIVDQKPVENFGNHCIAKTTANDFLKNPQLHQEVFGPFALAVVCSSSQEMLHIITELEGQLTGSIIGSEEALKRHHGLVSSLKKRVGRLIFNGVPTGVEVCGAMQHGGPYPASSDSRFGAVGTHSVNRWTRPISFQNWPHSLLPEPLKNQNPLNLWRDINGTLTQEAL